jgi:hypothetical protein
MAVFKHPPITGVNFGGWLSQCSLEEGHIRGFITEADFRQVSRWGFSTVRVPFKADLLLKQPGALDPAGLAHLERAVEMAEAHRLNIILDLHEVPGHSFVDMARNSIYSDLALQEQACGLWSSLARHFRRAGDWLLFELMNEPVAPCAADWQSLAGKLTAAIRKEDGRRPIVCGSNMWNTAQEFASLKPTGDERTVYTFHFYEPVHFTHQGAPWVKWTLEMPLPQPYPGQAQGLAEALARGGQQAEAQAGHLAGAWDRARLKSLLAPVRAFRDAHQVPVFCGEFGVYLKAPRQDQLRWMDDFTSILAEEGYGFTYWSHRSMDFGLYYEGERFGHLPQYSGEGHCDAELVALLRRASAKLMEAW